MARPPVPGTQGYDENAQALSDFYEAVDFEVAHRGGGLDLYPPPPARVLDIGSGSGRDAAALAARGYRVTAADPSPGMMAEARRRHPGAKVEWLDDALPDLPVLTGRGETFDLVLMTAVWMHLDETERAAAMPKVASLVGPHGRLALTLRYGPVPAGRRMFEVMPGEVRAQALAAGLRDIAAHASPSAVTSDRQAGVSWVRLAFERV